MTTKVDLDSVLQSLTLEEKILLLAGGTFWETAAFPAKGVPSIKTTDGPNGTRGVDFDGNTRAACFPAASSVAATFDRDIARRIGTALAEEARSKGATCVLAPTVCIHRHPLGGRNFESYSEDPFLTGTLASNMIQGVQAQGVAATIKHFVANEQETDRLTVDETISERALREIYLRPFEIAVKEAKPLAIMTAYNLINGVHCDANEWLLNKVLRGDWGWKGLVMSDWGGTNSVAQSLNAGLDLEMPGPARVRLVPDVLAAIKAGEVSEETINARAKAVLDLVEKLGAFESSGPTVERAIDRPEHRALIREAGGKGVVLLKNKNQILPISKEKVKGKKVALIGFAKDALANGGGSAGVNAHYKITPADALHGALGDSVEFIYAKGAHRLRLLPPVNKDGRFGTVVGLDGKPGFTRLLYDLDNDIPVSTLHGQDDSAYSPLGSQESLYKNLEIVADFTPSETGGHYLACSGIGGTQVFINDQVVFEQQGNCGDPMGALFQAASEEEWRYEFEAGKTYRLRIRTTPPTNVGMKILEGRSGVRLGFSLASEHDADLQGEAVRVAQAADLAIVFTGHDPQWETEGRDQESFNLPNGQNELIAAVASANSNTIVVNSTGVAISMPWLDQVSGLVQAWFPGQECGNAIADVLTGAVNPEGHLPVSFPKNIEDAPAHGNFPGTYVDGQLKVNYAEGVFVGYRHYDRLPREKVNFPFGFGLSYTNFELGKATIEKKADDAYIVAVDVSNTGALAGGTVVQLYAGNKAASPENPIKSLVAYQKVRLQPGEKLSLELLVTVRDFAHFDEKAQTWSVPGGTYDFSVGFSAADISNVTSVQIEKDTIFGL